MAIPTDNFQRIFQKCLQEESAPKEIALDLKVLSRLVQFLSFDHEPITKLCTIKLALLSYTDGRDEIYHAGYNYASSIPACFGTRAVKSVGIVIPGDYVNDMICEACEHFYSNVDSWGTFDTWSSFGTLGWGYCDANTLETQDFYGLGALEIQFELIRNLFTTLTFKQIIMPKGPLHGKRAYVASFGSRSSIETKQVFFDALWLRVRAALIMNRHLLFAEWSPLLNEVPNLRA